MSSQLDRLRVMVKTLKYNAEQSLEEKDKSTKVITIASGKGGVGKSNYTLNLALSLAELGKKVLVLDADLGLANIDLLLGISPPFNLYHLIHGQKEITDIIFEGPNGIKIIPGGSGIHELADLQEWQLEQFLTKLASIEKQFDFLLIDAGAGISKNVLNFTLAADEIIVITTPEPTSLADAYGLIKTLNRYKFPGEISVVVNRVADEEEGKIAATKLKIVADKFLKNCSLSILGFILEDKMVGESVKKQRPFTLATPYSPAAQNIFRMAHDLSKTEFQGVKGNQGIKGYFTKILSYFKK